MICPRCGYQNDVQNRVCERCGLEFVHQPPNAALHSAQKSLKAAQFDSSHKKRMLISICMSIVGAIIIMTGCFLPFAGSDSQSSGIINMAHNPTEKFMLISGISIMILMIISILICVMRYQKAALIPVSFAIGFFTFVSFAMIGIKGMDIKPGFYLIIAGAATTMTGSIVPFRGDWDKTPHKLSVVSVVTMIVVACLTAGACFYLSASSGSALLHRIENLTGF